MKVLIGTNNKAKIKKYGTILKELKIEYCTPKDLNLNLEIKETGSTSEENSIIKAKAYYKATKMPVIVDDSAMVLDKLAIQDQPGVFIRRYNGKKLADEEIIELYSKKIKEVGGETTGAFTIAVSVVDKNGKIYTNVIMHERLFVDTPCKERTEGYPMNSLIYNKTTGKYLAQEFEGKDIYKGNSFDQDFEFIESVLKKI